MDFIITTNNQCLYTPTDWNRECELIKCYLTYRSHFKTSVELFDEYISKGILYFGEKIMSFEDWKTLNYLMMKICDECGGKHYAKGKCKLHYRMPSQLNPKPIKSKVEVMSWEKYQQKKGNKVIKPKKSPTPLEDKSIQELVKLADIVFSKWIKKRDAINDSTFRCISCGMFKSIKVAQNGHFYSRKWNATRYHEDNCHLECEHCNCNDTNHLNGYRSNLLHKIGLERLKWLDEHYKDGKKWDREELLEIIKKYKV